MKSKVEYDYTNTEEIFEDFKKNEIDRMSAIEALQRLGYSSLDAEALVEAWET